MMNGMWQVSLLSTTKVYAYYILISIDYIGTFLSTTEVSMDAAVQELESKRIKPNRNRHVTFVGVSPLYKKGVNLDEPISMEEIKIWDFLFQNDKHEDDSERYLVILLINYA